MAHDHGFSWTAPTSTAVQFESVFSVARGLDPMVPLPTLVPGNVAGQQQLVTKVTKNMRYFFANLWQG